jgi:TonB-dependent receptor
MTSKSTSFVFSTLLALSFFLQLTAAGQSGRGVISGRVMDSGGAVLQGARVELQPGGAAAVTNQQGEFTISGLTPGEYAVAVNYVGFETFSAKVNVTTGPVARLDASLKVASQNEEIEVYAERVHGEAEAINRQRESDNILQVLPVEVITSLPNTNIADALGRLPSVTLERDEGEGKYVQIRGIEPRLNNVTIDGVNVPSPESGVRQIKLDIIPANLVDSVEISKTLSANQDGDAIGGSVNLVTKTAGERPTIYLNGIGGYTPIVGGRTLSEFDGAVGQRFGASKKLGVLFGGSYDWNGRGIDDIEPSLDVFNNSPVVTSVDLREYRYYRTRYGFTGTVDYKLGELSSIYIRGLYSHFNNFGDRWVYSPETDFVTPTQGDGNGDVSFNTQIRRPVEVIGSLEAGGRQALSKWLLIYEASVSRSSSEDHGYATATFDGPSGILFNLDWSNPNRPKLIPQNFNIYDPTLYSLSTGNDAFEISKNYSPQLNLQGAFSAARNYSWGGHFGTFEFGAKVRNAHKFQDDNDRLWNASDSSALMSQFVGSFTNPDYYDKSYTFGPTVDFNKVRSFFNSNPSFFLPDTAATVQNSFPNNYDLIERIAAGYAMNTLQFGRVRLQTGVRFENTNESLLGYQVFYDSNGNICAPNSSDPACTGVTNGISPLKRNPSYLDVLPSVQLRFGLGQDSAIRVAYGRGIARPNFSDLPPTFGVDVSNQKTSIGNPDLKPTHANNYDVLFEQYLKPLGVIQGGFFYKQLSDPIYSVDSIVASGPYAGFTQTQPVNGTNAHLWGFELAYQQHLTFLPSLLGALGISANYSYTNSKVDRVPLRTDSPALQRQAPNSWNISPTYDRGRLSARLGVSHNDANIFQYNYFNLNADGSPNPVPLGIKGPLGDVYLYAHTQVDAQGSFRMYHGLQLIVAGLNLTNEVFGFYQGSPRFPIQREYYKPSYEFGLRYTLASEAK